MNELEFGKAIEAAVLLGKLLAWEEGYHAGVADERYRESIDSEYEPARENPYRKELSELL